MPVEFPSFDLNDSDVISEDVKPDLEIIESEVMHSSAAKNPFESTPQRKKVFKPNSPSEQKELAVKIATEDKEATHIPVIKKAKKPLSEKQKAHLEKMRLKKANKKLESIKESIVSNDAPAFVEPTEEELLHMEKSEFDSWLKHMDKFEKIMVRMEQQKLKEKAEAERKELEQEAKYFKKFQEKQKQQQPKTVNVRKNVVMNNQTKKSVVMPPSDPLKQKQDDYYDSFFSF